MITIYLATGNAHKVGEFATLFAGERVAVRSAKELGGMPAVEENAGTFEGNALLKAQALLPLLPEGDYAMADDSGLLVDALDGEPGVHSARYAGPDATDAENRLKLLNALKGVEDDYRTARFRCCLVLISATEGPSFFNGFVEGSILEEERGAQGFGYDSLFRPLGQQQTFAELGSAIKDSISHRAKAVHRMLEWVRERS